jgi:ABC-2 type transport system ATP-binding protein
VRYGRFTAVDDISFTARPGRVTGFLGPNGAGKSTTMRVVVGLTRPTSGSATISGRPFADLPNPGLEVGVLLDASAQHAGRTGREILTIAQRTMGLPRARVEQMLHRVSLSADEADRRVRNYSLGMRQRLGIATALIGQPEVLVLDEPANGLDPAGKRRVHDVLAGLADRGTTVVLSSHRMDDLAALCDEVTLLSVGRAVFTGPVSKLAAESGELDYRVLTSDPERARNIAADVPALALRQAAGRRGAWTAAEPAIVVRGAATALDDLVARLVGAGIAIRELGPVVSPLEAAFLALTGADADAEEPPR